MTFRTILIISILTFCSCQTAKVEAQIKEQKSEIITSKFPKQIGFVNDFENIFTEEQKAELTKFLTYYQDTSFREIAVITIESIPENMEFEEYATKLSDNWKIGKDNDGNGLTILISVNLKGLRISTTDKTRYYFLSDEFCKKVVNENIIPEFKKGNYYDGLLLGLSELMKKWI